MFSATTYTIRVATAADEPALRRLGTIASHAPLMAGAVLVGEVAGTPEAAMSLTDGRAVANPFIPTAHLLAHLRMRAGAVAAYERTPSLPARLRSALRPALLLRPVAALGPAPV
jgi:hypothetical protein